MKKVVRQALCSTLLALFAIITLQSRAVAQAPPDIFGNLTTLVCRIGTSLSGPIALAVGFVVIAAGGIALAFGGRRSMSGIVWGLLGIAVALGAGTLITAAFGRAACG